MGRQAVVNYCFPTQNDSCTKDFRTQGEYVIMYFILFLISASTVFLNLLVIISVSHFKQLHTPTNLLLLSLAVADLHVGLLVMPVEGIRLIERCWYFGDTVCYIFPVIMYVVVSASLGNLIFISIDRYIAVCDPLNYYSYVTSNKAAFSIFLSWCGSVVYAMILLANHLQSQPQRTCHGECLLVLDFPRLISDVIFSFIAPCTIVICLYLRIFCVAKRQTQVINSVKNGGVMSTEKVKLRKSENKAAKTLGIVVAVYLLCWIPYYVGTSTATTYSSVSSSSIVLTVLIWAMYLNSCMNPIIYALFYPWFKISAKHILTLTILNPSSSYISVYLEDV